MTAHTPHQSSHGDLATLLELVGTLKDEVVELKEANAIEQSAARTGRQRRVAPGHSPDEPWAPCTREEVTFYASLTYLH